MVRLLDTICALLAQEPQRLEAIGQQAQQAVQTLVSRRGMDFELAARVHARTEVLSTSRFKPDETQQVRTSCPLRASISSCMQCLNGCMPLCYHI